MSFIMEKKLPTPKEIKELYPMSAEVAKCKEEKDKELQDAISGRSDRFIVIIGPCSADNEEAVCDYISRLVRVQEAVMEKVIIVPRVYTNKPRTTGEGYKGMFHQPDPEKAPNLLAGLVAIRHLHMRVLEQFRLPVADEMLYSENYRYLSDILSYVAVGALCGGPATPPGIQRDRGSGGDEEPYQRRFFCDAQFGCGGAARP